MQIRKTTKKIKLQNNVTFPCITLQSIFFAEYVTHPFVLPLQKNYNLEQQQLQNNTTFSMYNSTGNIVHRICHPHSCFPNNKKWQSEQQFTFTTRHDFSMCNSTCNIMCRICLSHSSFLITKIIAIRRTSALNNMTFPWVILHLEFSTRITLKSLVA